MPRGGARPGGGKRKGQWDRATLEAELASARQMLAQVTARDKRGRKLAIEMLDDLAHVTFGMVGKHQPPTAAPKPGEAPYDESKFVEWIRLAKEVLGELAPFQSAKFASVRHSVESSIGGTVPENPGVVRPLTGQEAYRMLRDSADLIELRPNPVPALVKPKTARG